MNGNTCNCCTAISCDWTTENEFKAVSAIKCGRMGFVNTGPYNYYKVFTQRQTGDPSLSFTITSTPNIVGTCDTVNVPATPYPPPGSCTSLIPDATTDTHKGDTCSPSGDPWDSDDLSDEDATAAMIARAQTLYDDADWESVFGFAQTVFEPTVANAISYLGSRFKIHHAPSASCYLQTWLRKKLIPNSGIDPGFGAWESIYLWNGSGYPCLDGATDGTDMSIVSGWITTDHPDDPGTIVEELFTSCIRGEMPPT